MESWSVNLLKNSTEKCWKMFVIKTYIHIAPAQLYAQFIGNKFSQEVRNTEKFFSLQQC